MNITDKSYNSTVELNHLKLKKPQYPISLNATTDNNQKQNLIIKRIKRWGYINVHSTRMGTKKRIKHLRVLYSGIVRCLLGLLVKG